RAVLRDLSLWRGTARGIEGSRVFLALSSAGVRGFLELPFADNRLVHYATGSDLSGLAVDDRDLASLGFERPAFDCPELRPPGTSPRVPVPQGAPTTETLT